MRIGVFPPRPRRKTPGGRWQSYCTVCHADYCRERREGLVEVPLTQEEFKLIRMLRAGELVWPI